MDNIPEYTINKAVFGEVNRGMIGTVYKVAKRRVAKVIHDPETLKQESPLELLQRELYVGRALYDAGISVPKPLGLFKLNIPAEGGERQELGLVMQQVKGRPLWDFRTKAELSQREFNRKWSEASEQYRKALNLGLGSPEDYGPHNVLWDEVHDKPYLIDFSSWNISQRPS